MTPKPFQIHVSDDVLKDLRARLERVRWPDEAPEAGWQHGSSLAYLKELVAYWRERYDWRTHEARLNRWKQFTVPIGGIETYYPEHSAGQIEAYRALCRAHDLVATGGSDYHGPQTGRATTLGSPHVPLEVWHELKARAARVA